MANTSVNECDSIVSGSIRGRENFEHGWISSLRIHGQVFDLNHQIFGNVI